MIFIKPPSPKIGDVRKQEKFLLIPQSVKSKWAWMGKHTLIYQYTSYKTFDEYDEPSEVYMWELIDIQ